MTRRYLLTGAGLFLLATGVFGARILAVRGAETWTFTPSTPYGPGYESNASTTLGPVYSSSTIYLKCEGSTDRSADGQALSNGTASYVAGPPWTSMGGGAWHTPGTLGSGVWDGTFLTLWGDVTAGSSTLLSECGSTLQVSTSSSDLGTPTISFFFPTDGTTTPRFYNWYLTETLPASTTISVITYDVSSTTLSFDRAFWVDGALNGATNHVSGNLYLVPATIPPIPMPATTTWYAEAGIFYPGNSTPIATTSVISFTTLNGQVIPSGQEIPGQTSSTPSGGTTNCAYTSSSFLGDPVGNIQQGICNALVYLFVPNVSQQGDISDTLGGIKTNVQNKPPFGYIGTLSTAISGLHASSTSSSTPVMDASSSAALAPFMTKMDAGIVVCLWLLFTVWFFKRASYIDL